MRNELEQIIKNYIAEHGMMRMDDFMHHCLANLVHGYYNTRDPFGAGGDFITAPEISQLFGEMIGIFFRQIYEDMGAPEIINLVECGAGRGTMLRDMLRVLCPKIKVNVHIVEMSKPLRAIQTQTIGRDDIVFHDSLETLPDNAPLFIVGNEFLDAIPVRQAIAVNGKWYEHGVGLVNDKLAFVTGAQLNFIKHAPQNDGNIFEFSEGRDSIHKDLCQKIAASRGVLLWIDYGFDAGQNTASVQAVKAHKYANILENIGQADISSLVDFERLIAITPPDLNVSGVITQKEFLKNCGIDIRRDMLIENNPNKADDILSGYHRLMDDDQMGALFKAMTVMKL
jgi:NADH dehydrogenase [ubiquinone] 1 alpha subcomplex assembly factor 7